MSKKNFSESKGIGALFNEVNELLRQSPGGEVKQKTGRPQVVKKEITNTAEEGTLPGEIRATFILGKDLLSKVKALAYWERKKIKDVVITALSEHVSRYEKKNGEIKPMPEK